jgi:hypothetical protein
MLSHASNSLHSVLWYCMARNSILAQTGFFTSFELHVDWRSFKVFQSCAIISNRLAMSLISQKINALFKLTSKRVNLCQEAVDDQQRRDKPDEHSVNGAPNAAFNAQLTKITVLARRTLGNDDSDELYAAWQSS